MNRRALPLEVLHRPRVDDTGRVLATRRAVAVAAARHVDVVRRRVPAVACDATTGTELVDLADADKILALLPRRESVSA